MNGLTRLPADIQNRWGARLEYAALNVVGAYKLIAIRPTRAHTFEEQRVIVSIVDESGQPIAGIPVAFSYSTADVYTIGDDFTWNPPPPQRAFIVPTGPAGTIDQIQGSAVKEGQAGGITVYILDPRHSSDVVTGVGVLADHTGLHLTFQLQRVGVKSIDERLSALEAWVTWVEGRLKVINGDK